MARRQIIIAIVAFAAVQCSADLKCSKLNEERRCVAKCPPEDSCLTRDIQDNCMHSTTEHCKDACVCKVGYFRNATGECVSRADCDKLVCIKPNEEKRCVAECPPQKTCRTRGILVKCLESATLNCTDSCVCKEGYYKNIAGECVSSDDCDKCSGQNQYYSCRTKPDKLCTDLKKTKGGDYIQSTSDTADAADADSNSNVSSVNGTQCKAQCYCAPGYARDENNVCVPYDQCNQPCDDSETKDYCPSDCSSDYCPKSEANSVSCPKPDPCPRPKCKCRFNYRRTGNGTCIPTRECPPFKCKKPFEAYTPCPPLCPNGYCGQATPDGRCPAIFGRIGIVLECNPACRCKTGYWWNEKKECIPYNQCPGKGDTSTTTTTTSAPITDCCQD